MAFYQIADSYVQRVMGSKSAQKADERDEPEDLQRDGHDNSEQQDGAADTKDGEEGLYDDDYADRVAAAIKRTYASLGTEPV
jgi:hypothetical protein